MPSWFKKRGGNNGADTLLTASPEERASPTTDLQSQQLPNQIREQEAMQQTRMFSLYNDLKRGHLMNNEQLDDLLNSVLTSRVFSSSATRITPISREILECLRNLLRDFQLIIADRNGGEELQRLFYHVRLVFTTAMAEINASGGGGGGGVGGPSLTSGSGGRGDGIVFHPDSTSTVTVQTAESAAASNSQMTPSSLAALSTDETRRDIMTVVETVRLLLGDQNARSVSSRVLDLSSAIFTSSSSSVEQGEEQEESEVADWDQVLAREYRLLDMNGGTLTGKDVMLPPAQRETEYADEEEKRPKDWTSSSPFNEEEYYAGTLPSEKLDYYRQIAITTSTSTPCDEEYQRTGVLTPPPRESPSKRSTVKKQQRQKQPVEEQELKVHPHADVDLNRREMAILLALHSILLDLSRVPGIGRLLLGFKQIWYRASAASLRSDNKTKSKRKSSEGSEFGRMVQKSASLKKGRRSTSSSGRDKETGAAGGSSLFPNVPLAYDTNTRQLLRDVKAVFSALLDHKVELDGLIADIVGLTRQIMDDYALHDYLNDWFHFINACVNDPSAYLMLDEDEQLTEQQQQVSRGDVSSRELEEEEELMDQRRRSSHRRKKESSPKRRLLKDAFISRASYLLKREATVSGPKGVATYRQTVSDIAKQLDDIRRTLVRDPLLMRFKDHFTGLLNALAKPQSPVVLAHDMSNVMIPSLIDQFKVIYEDPTTHLSISNILLSTQSILPKIVDLIQRNHLHYETDYTGRSMMGKSSGGASGYDKTSDLVIGGIQLSLTNLSYVMRRKGSIIKASDRGKMDINIPGNGGILNLQVLSTSLPSTTTSSLLPPPLKLKRVSFTLPKPVIKFRESKHPILNRIAVAPYLESRLKKDIEKNVEQLVRSFFDRGQKMIQQGVSLTTGNMKGSFEF